MQIEKININDIVEYENNAKQHPEWQIEQIVKSIQEFGFNDPIAVDEDNVIIEGHGRYLALKVLGYKEVDCIRLTNMTEEQKRAYILAHNKLTLNTGFDLDKLEYELNALKVEGIDIELTGFSEQELSKLFDDSNEVKDDDFDIDQELEKPQMTKFGDIWKLGRHTLICGDSTKEETYTKLLGDKKVNLVLTAHHTILITKGVQKR